MNQLALTLPNYPSIPENLNFIGQTLTLKTDTPADIINTLIPIIFILAGIILLFILVFGGFTIFLSAGNPEKIKKGTGMITSALIGFLIIFAAYWIIELLQITFGINILGTPPAPPTPPIPNPCPRPPCFTPL